MAATANGRPAESQRYMDYRGAALYTGLSQRLLADLVARRILRVARVGRRVVFDVEDLNEFMSKCKR